MNSHNLPPWLKKKKDLSRLREIKKILRRHRLHTVCEEAKCPNITECFAKRTATFMILGNICTRNCRFCAVDHGIPGPVKDDEPEMIADMAKELGLKYAVITSVTRDDLPDGGANHFCRVIDALKKLREGLRIEVLIPDFNGDYQALEAVLEKKPDVLNHNLETVRPLYGTVRPGADFDRSLSILRKAREYDSNINVKTGIMVGLGEKEAEVNALFRLIAGYVDIMTIGQYIAPSQHHLKESRFYTIQDFEKLKMMALDAGIRHVICGPFVRSSYNASDVFMNTRE